MSISATVSPGKIFSENESVTISKLNALGTPTVDIAGAVGSLSISNNSIANAHIQSGAAIQYDKLESLSTGQLVVGNGGTPTAATLSGDATIDAAGALTIATGAVETAMIADSTGSSDGITTAKLATGAVSGPKIAMGSDAQGDILYYNGSAYARLAAGTSGQVLQTGGASANPSWVDQTALSPSVARINFYNSGTSQIFTVPSGVTRIRVTAVGGGGGGAGDTHNGSAGGYFEKTITVTSGTDVTYSVGSGGAGQSGNGSSGGDTTVEYDSTTYTAGGGGGGGAAASGVATNGDINVTNGASRSYLGYGGGGAHGDDDTGSDGQSGFVKIEY